MLFELPSDLRSMVWERTWDDVAHEEGRRAWLGPVMKELPKEQDVGRERYIQSWEHIHELRHLIPSDIYEGLQRVLRQTHHAFYLTHEQKIERFNELDGLFTPMN